MTRLRILLLVSCAALSAAAEPSPTRAELETAEKEVREIVEDILEDLQSGEITRAEAAEEARIRASQVEKPAEEYLLLQGAFQLFMRAREYPRAADLLRHMHAREFPPEALVSLAEQALEPVPRGEPVAGLDAFVDRACAEAGGRARSGRGVRAFPRAEVFVRAGHHAARRGGEPARLRAGTRRAALPCVPADGVRGRTHSRASAS